MFLTNDCWRTRSVGLPRSSGLRASLVAPAEHTEDVGFELVEVNPLLDVRTGITSHRAACTIAGFLGHIRVQPRWIDRSAARIRPRHRAS